MQKTVLVFRPQNHPLRDIERCPKCGQRAVSLPAYLGDYCDCEACGHSWPIDKKQRDAMLAGPR